MKTLRHSWVATMFLVVPIVGLAQLKIGFVQSERIRAEYDEFKEAETQLQMEFRKAQLEYQTMADRLDSLKQDYEAKQFMSSPEWLRERDQEITQLEQQVQQFQVKKVGPEGDLYKKQLQLENDIIQKVQKAVSKVAIDKGYDYILDSISLLYAKPTHNLTDDVLYELKKSKGESRE